MKFLANRYLMSIYCVYAIVLGTTEDKNMSYP